MRKIDYTIKILDKNSFYGKYIYEIVVPDSYDRAMLFLRPQEYMESPNPKFRGNSFDIWDYIKWYSKTFKKNKGFTYAVDWNGFNFPLSIAIECYKKLPKKYYTIYDHLFLDILGEIVVDIDRKDIKKIYIISFDKPGSSTMYHEQSHAKYFICEEYRKTADKITASIPPKTKQKIFKNMHKMGYFKDVMKSEIQAYLKGKDWFNPDISKGIKKETLLHLHKKYKEQLNKIKVF